MFDIMLAHPGTPRYDEVRLFAQTTYLDLFQARIDPRPRLFVYASDSRTIVGCFGLYVAHDDTPLLFETYVPDACRRITGDDDRSSLAELGTKIVRPPHDLRAHSQDISIAMTARLIIEAHRIGVRYVGFTTNRLVRRVTDRLGFELIELGAPSLDGKDDAFKQNWREYFRRPQYCFGFVIRSLDQCHQALADTSGSFRSPGVASS